MEANNFQEEAAITSYIKCLYKTFVQSERPETFLGIILYRSGFKNVNPAFLKFSWFSPGLD